MNNDELKIPNHLAIIMDGNGRWAKERGLSRSMGHLEGSKTLEKIAHYAFERGVKILSVFAFSTENFKRSKEEVDYLMNLFVQMFDLKKNVFNAKDIKVVFSKKECGLPDAVEKKIISLTEKTKNNKSGILNICINYGGQDEIVDTSKKLIKLVNEKKLNIDDITKEVFTKNLYQDLEPIDLLIRTSGEQRISNFMLWQMAYSELYFTKTYFPSFNENDLEEAFLAYNKRERRFGGIKDEKKNN